MPTLITPETLTDATDADVIDTYTVLLVETERRRTLRDARDRQDRLAGDYAKAIETEKPTPVADAGDRFGPGQRIVWTDGHTWRNTSGAWLPSTANPKTYPLGWAQETGLPEKIKPWEVGETVKAGDLRSYEGATYRCLRDHKTQADWLPPLVASLWAKQG